jgi:hypothetical protein
LRSGEQTITGDPFTLYLIPYTLYLMHMKDQNHKTNYFDIKEVFTYFFRKKDPDRPSNFNIRAMHTINKISILIFLAGVIYLVAKYVF